jgi:RNA polymerase sigma factor (sigma-70 family)
MDSTSELDEGLVDKARGGDMVALDALVRRHQSWVFNLALRMVWRREVAEDATQEILIKAVTKLSAFAGQSAFRTWLYRIAVNHLLNVCKSEMEEQKMTFTGMGASLDGVPDEDLPDERALPVETKLLVEEAKLGCITAMLMCLDRRQRLAFILGEVLGETSAPDGGSVSRSNAGTSTHGMLHSPAALPTLLRVITLHPERRIDLRQNRATRRNLPAIKWPEAHPVTAFLSDEPQPRQTRVRDPGKPGEQTRQWCRSGSAQRQ